ncbi:hypothetical protein CRM22_008800 [Opisthorchis felineus]|uniref:MSP domain-containing protein n=1 Tax=Opisthorchis felineus TaxID=147828 RepID=A0A4S2LBH1_OPIFE|nr:hypothetical protein CRM22_008800 [Opisthorchis felineus]TGZ59936.1 hypothetical protein CRM22_008800 [Opisthorchis felineus]
MDSYNDVIVRPTEITFSRTAVNPVEVLILNRSQKRLRYKILCTARGTYALSKCKGTLCQEAFVKINIELIRVSLLEQNRRDFFKIQFFDCLDDSLQGERFISSVVLPDPTASSYRSLDSDSCNSWPNRSIDNLSVASNPPRALSLVRPMDSLSTCSVADRSDDTPHAASQLASSSPGSLIFLAHSLQKVFCFLAFLLCFVGICLPMVTDELSGWLHLLPARLGLKTSTTVSPNISPDGTCDVLVGEGQSYRQVSPSCSPTQQYKSDRRIHNLDEFARHSQLAILSLKTAAQSIYSALSSLNPLSMIANFSWFCLGLLVMYTLKRQ